MRIRTTRALRRNARAAAVIIAILGAAGCAAGGPTAAMDDGSAPRGSSATTAPPGSETHERNETRAIPVFPAGAVPDYQLGGAYAPDPEVGILARDRTAEPDPERFSICYVNGFQTQPGELGDWPEDLILRGPEGTVFDPEWPDEALLDTSTAAQRERILAIVGPWIAGCADAGFAAVEFDNLDSYTRSGGALDLEDDLALAGAYADAAHAAGLAAGQKNAAEDAERLRAEAGFDFAVAEECAAYAECGAYAAVYGDRMIDIEYADRLPRSFARMCADPASPTSMVLRDRELARPGDTDYVFETCG
ncbi:endo alpha-1,4 polygalactosaminidase [Leucobacter allii]|uniref:endo alpha-1,4 polygalactosaminidase n=1 Tax=Leucobacter allii TaxID=2932247 RepID=UPI001FD36BC8|nr:endo alpha-1,4 polygalactosaminidase [Leucobacter allii]UOR01706.1 endo alpha-1,4 polygalactosaminidase [Leucobacter allii]